MNWIRAFLESPGSAAPVKPDYEKLYYQLLGYAEARAESSEALCNRTAAMAYRDVADYARTSLLDELD